MKDGRFLSDSSTFQMRFRFIIAFTLQLQLASTQYCAENVQKCAAAAEPLESIVQKFKTEAFEACVKRPQCHEEKSVFDECYKSSVRTMRSSFLENENDTSNIFFDLGSQAYLGALDQCFMHSPLVPKRERFGPIVLDEDSVYARGLYGAELADRLWGLPELRLTRPSLDTMAVCREKDPSRVFGGGINRLVHSGDPKLNNFTSSCILEESELICYRQMLDGNPQYIQALYQRDFVLRNCFQTMRRQTPCSNHDHSRLRTCVCAARAQLDKRMEADLLDCVRRTSAFNRVVELSSVHDSSTGNIDIDQPKPKNKFNDAPVSKLLGFTKGQIINGECLCSCGKTSKDTEKRTYDKREANGPRFKQNSPRFMEAGEALGHVEWEDL